MPLNLSRGDRKLLLVAGVIFLLLVAGAVIVSGGGDSRSETPTTYSTASGGAKAAYLLLKESGFEVARWQRSLRELPDPAGKTLILAEPAGSPTREERERLNQFLREGGRVIATGPFGGIFLPESGPVPDPLAGITWKKVPALMPSAITRVAPEITLAPQANWRSQSFVLPLYGEKDGPVVVKFPVGKGEVIWWASATPLTNAGMKEPGNLEFFFACVGSRENTQILFDEYFHGYRDSLTESAAQTPVKWIMLQVALLGLAILLTFSRRSGPICVPVGEVRLSPLEFVQTLGGLYERANAASVAVDICYQRFRYWLTRRLGMASNAAVDDLERAVRERWGFTEESFAATLRSCESARYYTDLPPKEALRLVRALYDYAARLKLFRVSAKEKD